MTSIAVAITNVTKTFAGNDKPALAGVSIDIRKNEFFTLLGPSGCGKTTLLRMIAGFEMPDSGVIALDGVPMGATPPHRRPVNTVFQSYALFPHMTVAQNIAFGLEMLRRPRGVIEARVSEMLRLLQLDGLQHRRPSQLSGGQQQRVALGRALAPEPQVLLLDEPLSALDLKLRKEMQIELKRLQGETGITFVFVTHDQEEAIVMSDRVAVMQSGSLMQVATPRLAYDEPANLAVASFVGETNKLSAVCAQRDGRAGRFALVGDAGEISAHAIDDGDLLVPGARAIVVVRPEHVRLADEGSGSVQGQVTTTVYNGSDIVIHAELRNGEILRARVPGSADVSALPGTVAHFAFAEDRARAYPS